MPGFAPPEPPTTWEETVMKEEFEAIYEAFRKWSKDFEIEIDVNTKPLIQIAELTLEQLSEVMTGEL